MSGSSNVGTQVDQTIDEDPKKLAEFEAKITRREHIEHDDWMPKAYRASMIKMAEHHANSEVIGALPEGEWIARAPSLYRKLALTAKVQDEVGHGQMLYRVAQDLGRSRDKMLRDLVTSDRPKYHSCFNYPAPTWGDVAMIQWLIDGAAILNQGTLAEGSFGPYTRTMRRINMEEAFHFKSGEHMVLTLLTGTKKQRHMAQEAFDRWWYPALMFFGPPDKPNAEELPPMRWRMKTMRNDEMRRRFINRFAPAAQAAGLVINVVEKDRDGMVTSARPDPEMTYNEQTQNWGFTEPDWDEFRRVIGGDGPCNRERVAIRRLSYTQGHWVRTAILSGQTTIPPAA